MALLGKGTWEKITKGQDYIRYCGDFTKDRKPRSEGERGGRREAGGGIQR